MFLLLLQIGNLHGLCSPPLPKNRGHGHLSVSSAGLIEDLSLARCCHPFDQRVYKFYRNNFHEKRKKRLVPSLPENEDVCPNDAIYVLHSPQSGIIMAALRLTRSKHNSEYCFLRSLCVSREHRRHGLALRLLNESVKDFEAGYCYCFASPHLESLYQQASFLRIPKGDMDHLPKWLVHSYQSMDARWSRKTVGMYIRPKPARPERSSQEEK